MTKTNTNTETKVVKVTKKDNFKTLLGFEEVQARPDLVEFIEHEIELLERKNSGSRKPTANQLVNAKIKEVILKEMSEHPNQLYTATQLAKIAEPIVEISPLSNQRLSAILRGLLEEKGTGEVKRIEDKKNTYFQIA